ncbi:MAG: ABC transporter permease [Treponema sp.]|jgi:simple sugar transport system permease protein|nr:ABC transporter permease [Treponema sp.]
MKWLFPLVEKNGPVGNFRFLEGKRLKTAAGTFPGFGAAMGALITVGAAILLIILLIAFNVPNPGRTMGAFFILPWSSAWFAGNTLDSIALLLTASLGFVIAFRGGCFNLGGEGQIYIGGIAASAALLSGGETGKGGLLLPAAALCAAAAGGGMGAVSGILKKRFGADELITSFLLSAALTPLGDYFIAGPLRDPSGNLLASPRFAYSLRFPRLLPPSSLSLSLIFALLLLFAGWVFINRTGWGYRFRIAGADPGFARFGGIAPERCWVPALGVSGALGGLAGFFAVAGTYGLCHLGFSGGLGWNAVAAALIARNRPLALIPAALIFGWLKAGSDAALLSQGLQLETTAFIQAAVLLLATIRFTGPAFLRFLPVLGRKHRGDNDD